MVSPIILIYTMRYGIGTDYFSYKEIYEILHKASLPEYLTNHNHNIGAYYVEPGYYLLNRFFCFSYRSLLFITSVIIMFFLYHGILSLTHKSFLPLCVLIYFCTQFIYSMNGVRFTIAITIVFWGIQFIIKKKCWLWILCIILAMGFHKTSLICFPLYFLGEMSSKRIAKIRNYLWYFFIFAFPMLWKGLFEVTKEISIFSRYFTTAIYTISNFTLKPMFLFHILPVLFPLFFAKRQFILHDEKASLLLKIMLFEIPLRELGSLNTFLTRFARFPQMVQIVFIPYVLSSVKNQKLRVILTIYYVAWYSFYFIYGAIVNDAGDSLPYRSILFMSGAM